jgi:hypothetical protein
LSLIFSSETLSGFDGDFELSDFFLTFCFLTGEGAFGSSSIIIVFRGVSFFLLEDDDGINFKGRERSVKF